MADVSIRNATKTVNLTKRKIMQIVVNGFVTAGITVNLCVLIR